MRAGLALEYRKALLMASPVYTLSPMRRLINVVMTLFVRLGIGPAHTYLLTVRGRKSGRDFTRPVTLVEEDGRRWLVAPYGEVAWVKNARAAGAVTLARGGRTQTLAVQELPPADRAPVLKSYIRLEPITQPFFDAKPDSPAETFAAEADRHPVFLLLER